MSFRIAPGTKLVMIGDSITDCGRARPVGEGRGDALGTGYVALIDSLLRVVYPAHSLRIVNVGTGGNTVRDLKARWQSDVLDLQPGWLSIMIGINDVWRQFDSPQQTERHVGLDEYTTTLDELVRNTRTHLDGLVLMTPYFLELHRDDPMRATMDAYGAVVQRIAGQYDAVFVNTQQAFDRLLAHMHPMSVAWDRVHPNQTGHMVLAKAWLDALGFEWAA